MNPNYPEIMIQAWTGVLEAVSTKRLLDASVQTEPASPDPRDICALINIVGDLSGQVSMSMDADTGMLLASEMLGGMEISEVDELVVSAVGELCNMMMGSVCSSMSALSHSVDITPPVVLVGEEPAPSAREPLYRIALHMESLEAVYLHLTV